MGQRVTSGRILVGQYHDSVWLMRASEALRVRDGIDANGIVMGTPRNIEMLEEAGLMFAGVEEATPNDVVIAVRGRPDAVEQALADVPEMLVKPAGGAGQQVFASTSGALETLGSTPAIALVSVNGEYAAAEAREALAAGLDVMIFSDNVSLEDEVELKRSASELGLLVMGPDCGTAIVHGIGLGFANEVIRGPVGIVAASGTGAQVVATTLSERGVGVSHLIGLGGRDLEDQVGGRTLWSALAALENDPQTEVVVLVAKKTGQQVFRRLLSTISAMRTPVVTCLLGPGAWWVTELAGASSANSLNDAAVRAAALVGAEPAHASGRESIAPARGGAALAGRFAGGTLALEALDIARSVLGDVSSNLASGEVSSSHSILDLGADEYTVSSPHPMINPAAQAAELRAVIGRPEVGAVLFDVVLGHGGHADPASVLASAIEEGLRERGEDDLLVIGSVCGTDADPQNRSAQIDRLRSAGAVIAATNAEAAFAAAIRVADGEHAVMPAAPQMLERPLQTVVNVGSSWFADALAAQDVGVIQVDWRPPAGGDATLRALLDDLI